MILYEIYNFMDVPSISYLSLIPVLFAAISMLTGLIQKGMRIFGKLREIVRGDDYGMC